MIDLDPELLEILACPVCASAVRVDDEANEIVCTGPDCRLAYPVRDGIPVMLIDEARRPEPPAATEPVEAESAGPAESVPSDQSDPARADAESAEPAAPEQKGSDG